MVELPVAKPKRKKPELPIGVMPNYAYGKTQFDNLQIRKDIDKFLDPLAELGWHLYTTGGLEIRNVDVLEHMTISSGGIQFPAQQPRHDAATPEKVTEYVTFGGKHPIDRPFMSATNIPKIVVFRGDRREGETVYEDQLTLVHELRHAGLDYLNKLIQQDEQKQVKTYEPKYESKRFLNYEDPQKTEHKEVDDRLNLFNSKYRSLSENVSAEESLFTIMDFLALRKQLDMETFEESGSEEDIEKKVYLNPAFDMIRIGRSRGYSSALELYEEGLDAPYQFSFYKNYPKYEAARTWVKEVDKNIKTLNDVATKQLNILKNKNNVKKKPTIPKKDVGVIKTFLNLILGK
jgi:hypothetical protein